jgi:hypothetical protein
MYQSPSSAISSAHLLSIQGIKEGWKSNSKQAVYQKQGKFSAK